MHLVILTTKNHLIPGKFKDEGAGSPFSEGVFLRSKMYSLMNESTKHNKSTAKGISRRVIEKYLVHSEYVRCIGNVNNVEKIIIPKFQKDGHRMNTVHLVKRGLSV